MSHPGNVGALIDGQVHPAERIPKRPLEPDSSSFVDNGAHKKRSRTRTDHERTAPLRFLIVHKVLCGQHSHHPRVSELYEDTPRLYRGDDKTAHLRGTTTMDHDKFDEEFVEGNPDISFVVVREYDCGAYHASARHLFKHIPISEDMVDVLKRFRLQLTLLEKDCFEAEPSAERIMLISGGVLSGMNAVRSTYPAYFASSDPVNGALLAPYPDFYHGRMMLNTNELDSSSHLDDEKKAHIRLLSGYIQSSSASDYQEADEQFKRGVVSRKHLDKLFCPEDIVVRATESGPLAYKVRRIECTPGRMVRLNCWSWAFDGKFYQDNSRWDIPWNSSADEVIIESMSLYPLRTGDSELRTRLLERGKTFWKYRNRKLVEYNSLTSGLELQPGSNRYMIDLSTYRKMHPELAEDTGTTRMYQEGIQDLDIAPEDPFLFLLPATVRGFRFHDKKWNTLIVERIKPVEWSEGDFEDRLVLKEQKKELIKALVTVHTADRRVKMDIVDGKGRGLILLLHGGPGTGKTLTAESIAEFAQKPLYRVTCGDIGTDPESVERYLESILYIGTLWGCVVLLDEADVFLEERVPTDLQRNALVSVFLRALEYFEGILVLTSNRVGTFDEAFKSRVQLAMRYPPLDEDGRWQVWSMLLKELLGDDERSKYDQMKDKLNFLARHELNGRQIRNTINTARQLARFRKKDLAYEHLEIALDVVKEFESYVIRMRGHTDEEYAKVQGHR